MRTVFITGKDGLTAREAAHIVINEARALVKVSLGLAHFILGNPFGRFSLINASTCAAHRKNELGVREVGWSQIDNASQASPGLSRVQSKLDTTTPRTTSAAGGIRPSQVADETEDKRLDKECADHSGKDHRSAVDDVDAVVAKNIARGIRRLSKSSEDSIFGLSGASINDLESKERHTSGDHHQSGKLPYVTRGDSSNDTRNFEDSALSKMLVDGTSSAAITKRTNDDRKDLSINSEASLVFSEDPTKENGASASMEITSNGRIARAIDSDDRGDSDKRSEDLYLSSEDVINESDREPELGSRVLRSKLLEKTKSLLKEGQIMAIRSLDFHDKMGSRSEKSVESQIRSKAEKSFQVSDRALDEVFRNAEMENDKGIISAPAPPPETKGSERREARISAASSNCYESPSLFSDSSFFDPQMCSILEKNVIDSDCLADFEKSNFTPENEAPDNIKAASRRMARGGDSAGKANGKPGKDLKKLALAEVPVDLISNHNNSKDGRVTSQDTRTMRDRGLSESAAKARGNKAGPASEQLTWVEDSWDQVKYQRLVEDKYKRATSLSKGEGNSDSGSPSLLDKTCARGHLRQLISSQIALSTIQAKTAKDKKPDAAPMDSPKYIVRKRAYDKNNCDGSPIASVRTYNTRRPFMPRR
jgi:hypothetical protein